MGPASPSGTETLLAKAAVPLQKHREHQIHPITKLNRYQEREQKDIPRRQRFKISNATPDMYAPTFWTASLIPESSSAKKECSMSFLVLTAY